MENDPLVPAVDASNQTPPPASPPQQQVKLTDIPITNETLALNVVISFLHIAQKRGAFTFEESAKIWECVKFFVKAPAPASTEPAPVASTDNASTDNV